MKKALAFILYIIGGFGFIPLHRPLIDERISEGFLWSLFAILGCFISLPIGVGCVLLKIVAEGELILRYKEPIPKSKVDIEKLLAEFD